MMLRRMCRKHASIGLVAVALTASSLTAGIIAQNAAAAPSTKYYTSTASPLSLDVSTTTRASTTFTLANCSGSTCAKGSTQSWGSAHVTLPHGWDWGTVSDPTVYAADGSISTTKTPHWATPSTTVPDAAGNVVVELGNDGTSSTYAIAPGEYLTFSASLLPTPAGLAAITTQVKQSNDFSGTGNDFLHASGNTDPTIVIGPPEKIAYTQVPTDVQMTSTATNPHYMCPPVTAAVEDSFGHVVSWLPPTAVTLSSTGTPGLKLNGSTTLSADTVNGVATFGAGNVTDGCTAGLTATTQGSYQLTATTTVAAGAGYTGGTFATSAVGYNVYLTTCAGGSCNVDLPPGTQTNANVNGTNGPSGPTPLLGFISPVSLASLPSGCDQSISYRPEQTNILLNGYDKSVTLAWSKKVTNQDPRNGTPFWPVCIQGPYQVYVSDGAGGATLGDATHGAMLVLCSTTGVKQRVAPLNPGPDQACISSLYKNAASEHAVIWVPNLPGDPHFI